MKTELTPQQIAKWFRSRAERFIEIADFTEETFNFQPEMKGLRNGNGETKPAPRTTPLTAQELEKSVSKKSGRVNDLADRLGTTPTQIMSLLKPASRVYVAGRGWLKVE